MSGSNLDFALLVCFALFCWVLAASFLKPLYALWQRRKEYWFVNRHPSATWLLIAALFLSAVVSRPLNVYKEYLLQGDNTENAARITGFVTEAFNVPVYYGAIIVYCTRYWLIYFDFQMAVRCSDQRWKELLLTAPETDCHHAFDWFTAHKQTLGSWNYLKKIVAATVSVLFCAVVSLYWASHRFVPILQVLVLLSAFLFIFAVTVKMPGFCDTIKARAEYQLHAKVFAFFLVVYIAFVVLAFFKRSFLISVLRQTNNVLSYFCILFALLLWLPRQFEDCPPQMIASVSLSDISKADSLLLAPMISQTDGFRAFIGHLFSEFSYENLLCCVELLQFRQLHRAAIGEEDTDHSEAHRFEFPQEIMDLSPTIATNESESFERRFLQLYSKYISASASMPVNLSSRTVQQVARRAQLLRASETATIDYKVFDDVIRELHTRMKDSFSRFIMTTSFRSFAQNIVI